MESSQARLDMAQHLMPNNENWKSLFLILLQLWVLLLLSTIRPGGFHLLFQAGFSISLICPLTYMLECKYMVSIPWVPIKANLWKATVFINRANKVLQTYFVSSGLVQCRLTIKQITISFTTDSKWQKPLSINIWSKPCVKIVYEFVYVLWLSIKSRNREKNRKSFFFKRFSQMHSWTQQTIWYMQRFKTLCLNIQDIWPSWKLF